MVMTINQPCDTVDASGEWFGLVRWCDEDIEAGLEDCGIEVTEDNVAAVRFDLENGHGFTDNMIMAGWDYIHDLIDGMHLEAAHGV